VATSPSPPTETTTAPTAADTEGSCRVEGVHGPREHGAERVTGLVVVGGGDGRLLGQGSQELSPARVEHAGNLVLARQPHQLGVPVVRHSGRHAAREHDRAHLGKHPLDLADQRLPLLRRDPWAGFVEHGDLAIVDDRHRLPGLALEGGHPVLDPAAGERLPQPGAAAATGEPAESHVERQLREHPGGVAALAARTLLDRLHPVGGARHQLPDAVGEVERGVEADGQDHPRPPVGAAPLLKGSRPTG
jgi:hypothetical protein